MNATSDSLNDETISAFLDGELPPAEMEAVREKLGRQPELAARLAQLSQVDQLVRMQAGSLDAVPMPARVLELLGANSAGAPSAVVVEFPARRRLQKLGLPLALAASLLLGLGLWRGSFRQVTVDAPMAPYLSALESTPSGKELSVGEGRFLSNFSYRSKDNHWCRQFRWSQHSQQSDNIACLHDNHWQLEHRVESAAGDGGTYQPATGNNALDAWLDADMQGSALDFAAEAELLKQRWQPTAVQH